ncbi:hypothetical protein J6590_019759 [Homalodisca vitripennis]|nr:hypothetical protein J6590_019759 [Homalodisca vitripennis]
MLCKESGEVVQAESSFMFVPEFQDRNQDSRYGTMTRERLYRQRVVSCLYLSSRIGTKIQERPHSIIVPREESEKRLNFNSNQYRQVKSTDTFSYEVGNLEIADKTRYS